MSGYDGWGGPTFPTRTTLAMTLPHSRRAALRCHAELLGRLPKVQVSSYGSLVLVFFLNILLIVFPINGFTTLDLVTGENSMSIVGKNDVTPFAPCGVALSCRIIGPAAKSSGLFLRIACLSVFFKYTPHSISH